MALASGPALLSLALATQLYGRHAAAVSALAFALGTLPAPSAAAFLERRGLQPRAAWPLLGIGMVVGWATAPWHCACLIGAQLLAGLSMATFEGTMDTAVAKRYGDAATGPLAWTAFRALGGALAAGVTPMFVSKASLPAFGLIAAGILIALTIRGLAQRPQPARPRLSPTAQPDSA